MKIYNYDKSTGEYLSTVDAATSPMDGLPLIPAFATDVAPPPVLPGYVNTFVAGGWETVVDNRGKSAWDKEKPEDPPLIVSTLGGLPETHTLLDPSSVQFPEWDGTKWVESKDLTYEHMKSEVEARKLAENIKPFPFNGYNYKSDKSAKDDIEGVFAQCAHLDALDPIPTFVKNPEKNGKWLTMEMVLIPFTVEQFVEFSKQYFNRFSWNFDNRVEHLEGLYALYVDVNSTAGDILSYDFSGGWK